MAQFGLTGSVFTHYYGFERDAQTCYFREDEECYYQKLWKGQRGVLRKNGLMAKFLVFTRRDTVKLQQQKC